jgi:hypothetical protein
MPHYNRHFWVERMIGQTLAPLARMIHLSSNDVQKTTFPDDR